jgi:hypothetical protein
MPNPGGKFRDIIKDMRHNYCFYNVFVIACFAVVPFMQYVKENKK